MSLQTTAVREECQDSTEKDNGFLHNVGAAEGAGQDLLREITKMDHIMDTSDDAGCSFSENPQSDFLHEVETKNGSQENMFFKLNHWNVKKDLQVKEPGIDHADWMEKINNIIQKVSVTENTVKSLLNEVILLEGQTERLESHQDPDSDQGANIKADACNEARGLKEKLIERMENFCKDMTLGNYQMKERKTDSSSPEEKGIEETQALLPQSPPLSL